MRLLLFLFCLLPGVAFGAVSNTVTTSRDAVSLVSRTNTAESGRIELALRFRLAPGWHIYWSNPGDAGLAPQIDLAPPASAGAFSYPPPEFLLQDGVAAYVLSGDVVLPFAATGVGDTVAADAQWLVCSNICVPEHGHFVLPLAGGASAEAGLFKTSQVAPSPFAARIAPDGTLSVSGPALAQVAHARFFPAAADMIVNRADQPLHFDGGGLSLRLTPAPGFRAGQALTGVLELTDPGGNMQALSLDAAPGPARTPVAVWLALAFLGGLILNLMPCVFPVLAMKALGLARLGDAAHRAVRREAFGYTAGVLAAMVLLGAILLGLRAFGAAVGWGFQLQSPVFVALIALLVLAATLNLAGAFEVPGFSGFGSRLAPHGSFLTGLFAVAVATPCTAPFMGSAVAGALAAPLAAAFGIFLCLGLGLAAPFLLLALFPVMVRALPRPGRWMVVLQRLLSIPMFATFLWLGWVFTQQVSTAAPGVALAGTEAYSAPRLAALRGAGQPVFVDMTAAWCITCLVNDRTTLDAPAVRGAFAKTHTKVLLGDWTDRDPAITAFLQRNDRDGVPLYVYYAPGAAPVVLPQILTPGVVQAALR